MCYSSPFDLRHFLASNRIYRGSTFRLHKPMHAYKKPKPHGGLSDTSKFTKVSYNPKHTVNKELHHLLDMESAIKDCLDDLLNSNYLSEEDYKMMKPIGSRPGVMYGLCKVHKDTTDGQVCAFSLNNRKPRQITINVRVF